MTSLKYIKSLAPISTIFGMLLFFSCAKLIQIKPPTSTITTEEVFADSIDANSAILAIYGTLNGSGNNLVMTNGALSLYAGSSADELVYFGSLLNNSQIYTNSILSSNGLVASLWATGYTVLYQINASIAGIQNSSGISGLTKKRFIGECEFLRALVNFYMVNLFGDIPLVTDINYKTNEIIPRSSRDSVLQSIVSDLEDARTSLPNDYSASGNERIRANSWAATALLAKVDLFIGDYVNAENLSASVINNSTDFSLVEDLNGVFLADSREAILQWNLNTSVQPWNTTEEGYTNIPRNHTSQPTYYISQQLLNAFEPADKRKVVWLDSTKYLNKIYYFPYKYKNGPAQTQPNSQASEYYMVLRLAEQYLINAEASAKVGIDLNGPIAKLNALRERANLPPLPLGLSQDEILADVFQERKIELFSEWGNRWLDMKRTGQIDSIMSSVTPQKNGGHSWNSYQQLYPIPFTQLTLDHYLTQNNGY